jgi:DNA-binding NtrC family response regulator
VLHLASPSSLRNRSRYSVLFGASIGSGSAAIAVKQGGADFLLVGNVGRLRMMGAPSCTCHLPLRDSNELTVGFARSEILTAVDLPIFLGVAACDPRLDVRGIVQSVGAWGFEGLANFPTSTQLTGPYRIALEAAGLGFSRELEMLARAKEEGLSVLGYAREPDEIDRLAAIHADLICIQLKPQLSVTASSSLPELEMAANLARPIIAAARKRSPKTLYLCGGSAISDPEKMLHLCDLMTADGYIGGSTIDQLPVESSIEDRVAAFKAVASLRKKARETERTSRDLERLLRLATQSPEIRHQYASLARASRKSYDLFITGDPGTGKTAICEIIHQLSSRRTRGFSKVIADVRGAPPLEIELFGAAAGVEGAERARIGKLSSLSGGTLLVDELDKVSRPAQKQLLRLMEEKLFRVCGTATDVEIDVRLLFTSRDSLDDLLERGLIVDELYSKLKPFEFRLPALAERAEDLPLIIEQMVSEVCRPINPRIDSIEHAAVRTLQRQTWPGNLRDLRAALERAALKAQSNRIQAADLMEEASRRKKFATEKEWIIDALLRHKFRKGESAKFLGVARKTLYNKMKQYEIN